MKHKRGKPKNARAGCLLCKPNKMNGGNKDKYAHAGFGKLRKVAHAKNDMKGDIEGEGERIQPIP